MDLVKNNQDEISICLKKIFLMIGVSQKNLPDDDVMRYFLKSELQKIIFSKYSTDEVLQAVQLAMEGKITFDTRLFDRLISVSYFMDLMREYEKWKKITNKTPQMELPEHELTEEEKQEIIRNSIIKKFENYKNGHKFLLNLGNVTYEFLKDKIHPEPEQEAKLLKKATETAKNELDVKLVNGRHHYERNPIREALQRIESGNTSESEDELIEKKLCELKVSWFFDELIEMEMNIEDII